MRCLLLHGYGQNAAIIRKSLAKHIPRDVEVVTEEGPLLGAVTTEGRGWFPLERIDLINGVMTVEPADIARIQAVNTGYYDMVIGFSQGCLAACLLLGQGVIATPQLILFSPIPAPVEWPYVFPATGMKIEIVVGEADTLVRPEHSRLIIPALGDNEITQSSHRWGHVIPSNSEWRQRIRQALTQI